MKQYIIIIILALCLGSCGQHSKHWETLTQIESYIEERPDSVLNVLQGMDKDELSGMAEKAKHALLLSMAMDKNYIDRTDFDVLLTIIRIMAQQPISYAHTIIKVAFIRMLTMMHWR